MLHNRAVRFLISVFLYALVSWLIVSAAFGQARDTRRSAARNQGLAAWAQVYSVLIHPRCINCETATYYPQQGDDRRRHFANVRSMWTPQWTS